MSLETLLGSQQERKDIFTHVAGELGLPPIAAEKDFWVCWTLRQLVELDGLPTLTFKGGTSLSKVYRLIERFSEDIDLTYSRDGWELPDPMDDGISNKERRRRLAAIADRAGSVTQDLASRLEGACRVAGLTGDWAIEPDPADPQRLFFHYPPGVEPSGYLRPVVLLEFGARGEPWPVAEGVARSMVDEVVPEYGAGVEARIPTLLPKRTFWEKATAIHAFHHMTQSNPDKSVRRTSRHLYDLNRMWADVGVREQVLADPGLYGSVVSHKRVFFSSAASRYDLAASHDLALVPHDGFERSLRSDYDEKGEMFPSEPPAFDDLVASLAQIQDAVRSFASS